MRQSSSVNRPTQPRYRFEMDSAYQGLEALEKVHSMRLAGRPFAMAFIDMRMPPGWDGVETVERLWLEDPRLQIVLCTAYSDYSWPEVLTRLQVRDRLLILKKPFDAIEVYQFANALTTKWQMTEQAAFKMTSLEEAVEERTRELSNANIIVQNSPVILYRLRGEPAFPLIYISHNITKLGHDPQSLLSSPSWAQTLIDPDDQAKVGEAMARVFWTRTRKARPLSFAYARRWRSALGREPLRPGARQGRAPH
jgi:YesN/AraC family two-component response regulator